MRYYCVHHELVTVLKLQTVRVGGHGYYVNELPQGREAGTGLTGERPGRWMGRAAEGLGLGDRVEAEAFADVLSGRNPILGRPLPVKRDLVTVAAYDLVFCAPKSVSLLHALGSAELSSEVGAGHDAAVDATTDYLARVALGVRRQAQGGSRSVLPTTGMMAGAFLHRTSRALDPHLHTHVVEVNVAQGIDGVWSAVDGRGLFAHRAAAGRLYQAHLRQELTVRLGVAWDVRPTGLGGRGRSRTGVSRPVLATLRCHQGVHVRAIGSGIGARCLLRHTGGQGSNRLRRGARSEMAGPRRRVRL